MIYDKLTIALLTMLSHENRDSVNAKLARYLLANAGTLGDLSVKELASTCHVGTGTVSRFAAAAGFSSFSELKTAFATYVRSFETVKPAAGRTGSLELAYRIAESIALVERTIDRNALAHLVRDLATHDNVLMFGLLKAEAAARDLQVDLLMQGKAVETTASISEQLECISRAKADDLILIFSYTGTFFDYADLETALRRLDRPKIWMVCGGVPEVPAFVHGCVCFASDGSQVGHPYQLQYAASLIAQEYAQLQHPIV